MKSRILIIAVGQAGGNIGQELEKKDFMVHYINTSKKDLDSIKSKSKYKVPMAKGCYGDRSLALEYTKEYFEPMAAMIEDNFASQDQVFFTGSFGGATGSGIIPALLDILSRRNPEKNYGAIMIHPSMDEDISARQNAVAAFKQLVSRKLLKNLYVLDNNHTRDKFHINKTFAEAFNNLVNSSVVDKRGTIDEAEQERMFSTRGSVFLTLLNDTKTENNFTKHTDLINKNLEQNIFTEYTKGCKYIAISSNIDFDKNIIEDKLGKPLRYFRGYNDGKYNLIAAFGMKFPTERIDRMNESIESEKDQLNYFNVEVDIDVASLEKYPAEEIKKTKDETEEIDYNSIWEDLG